MFQQQTISPFNLQVHSHHILIYCITELYQMSLCAFLYLLSDIIILVSQHIVQKHLKTINTFVSVS